MDESWRMRIGMPTPKLSNNPPRRSTETTTSAAAHLKTPISDDTLNPDDFTDVFGGPPRTILSRQFSADLRRSSSFFYEDIFRQPYKAAPAGKERIRDFNQRWYGRNINGYCSDVFGWDDERVVRSRSRSKASSSSALSSEELSPLRPAVSDDGYDDVTLFASKLRPINVRSKWNSRRFGQEDYHKQQKWPSFADNLPLPDHEKNFIKNNPRRRNASLESIIDLDPFMTNRGLGMFQEDLQFNSPSSPVSSVSDRGMNTSETMDMEQEDDERMLSYVIEINSDKRELKCESNGIDEAIAWAKETFQTKCSEECKDSLLLVDEKQDECAAEEEEEEQSKVQTEMQLLDEKIRLWSIGKETHIRLLLSSLHHILWPNSGWLAIPLSNIIEISRVKKAYQKAQLCLHPDKLQQRGATVTQKYIAQKVFALLQDAWAAFVSEDVLCR